MVDQEPSSSSSGFKSMEGFGSAHVTSPFYYGSVQDGEFRSDSLEQKLKKQYWKTKQTVIQKLGKNQDEFVVAGDAEIDTKLEKAYHLQSSCSELLQVIDKYISNLRNVSQQESVMGEHLRTWSETEYTNAGEVMQNVGKVEDNDSKNRLKMIPTLLRMRNEFSVFRDSAIRDLNYSIQLLEKARTEYRAALLWMKNVSEKLHDPDYKNQLIRFREAQATVKETKKRFEKLKVDLGEKIDMVSASRCNLLSRSLPSYQKDILEYSDTSANDFHRLLVDLRSHYHHQYKVKKMLEEIRDLESDELPISNSPEQDFSSFLLPEGERRKPPFDDDEPLLDVGNESANDVTGKPSPSDNGTEKNLENEHLVKQQERVQESFHRVGDPFSFEKVAEQAKVNDLVLGGIEAELRALQNEMVQPGSYDPMVPSQLLKARSSPNTATEQNAPAEQEKGNEMDDLLQLGDEISDDVPLPSSLGEASGEGKGPSGQDALSSEWNNFSLLNPAARDDVESPLAGWEKEFTDVSPSPVLDDLTQKTPQESSAAETPQAAETTVQGGLSSGPLPPSIIPSSQPSIPVSNSGTSSSPLPVPSSSVPSSNSTKTNLQSTDIDELLGISGYGSNGTDQIQRDASHSSLVSELLSKDLDSLGLSPPKPVSSSSQNPSVTGGGLESINPTLFQIHSTAQQNLQALQTANSAAMDSNQQQQNPSFRSPLPAGQGPPVFPTQGSMGVVTVPPKFGLVLPGTSPATVGEAGAGKSPLGATMGSGGGESGGVAKGKDAKEKGGKTWMNFFAHLDPLVNEKA